MQQTFSKVNQKIYFFPTPKQSHESITDEGKFLLIIQWQSPQKTKKRDTNLSVNFILTILLVVSNDGEIKEYISKTSMETVQYQ